MKKFARRFNSMWGATLVICLTIIVASGATATASKLINGKSIKKGTVVGKALKNNTLTGTQINESKLGKVPSAQSADTATSAGNAATVGGLDTAALVRGGGHTYSRTVSLAVNASNTTVLDIPGFGVFRADCNGAGTVSSPEFLNTSPGSLAVVGTSSTTNPTYAGMDVNTPGIANNVYVPFSTRGAGTSTFQIWNFSGGGPSATVTFSSALCSFAASATTSN